MDLSVSIESLFGHLCFGSTFAHDEEMKMLVSRRQIIRAHTNDCDSQTVTSSRERCVDQRDTSSASLGESASDPDFHALDNLEDVPKRQRTSPSLLGNQSRNLNSKSLPTEVLSPKRKLPDFKQSFKGYLRHGKRGKRKSTPRAADPPSSHIDTYAGTSRTAIPNHEGFYAVTHLKNGPSANTLQNERLANLPESLHRGAKAEAIGLSDGDHSSQGQETDDFLLTKLLEPGDIPHALCERQLGTDTQVTLSDAAFGSQASHSSTSGITAMRLQRRKEAYKAAKEPSGIWEIDNGLISSHGHHGEEEVEL